MRTYSQADWTRALDEWAGGAFSDEWKPYRHQAAMRGMIFPPTGSKWDSWDDDQPSQRAILIRAIRETPQLTKQAIAASRSWHEVVAYIMKRHQEWREEIDNKDRDIKRALLEDRPTHGEAMRTIAAIIDRIGEAR